MRNNRFVLALISLGVIACTSIPAQTLYNGVGHQQRTLMVRYFRTNTDYSVVIWSFPGEGQQGLFLIDK